MNLVIDFGNTAIKAAIFEGEELTEVLGQVNLKFLSDFIRGETPDQTLVSSVSSDHEEIQKELGKGLKFLSVETPLPFKNNYQTPQTLGLDRLAAVAGAQSIFPNSNCLTIDMGTCITYDLITEEGFYEGGGISPGLNMRFKSIKQNTARLPLVEINPNPQLIGRSTVSCIQSGVFNGLAAELNGIVSAYESKYDRLEIIMCGGDMKYFENTLKRPIFAAPELVLRGLNRILIHNA